MHTGRFCINYPEIRKICSEISPPRSPRGRPFPRMAENPVDPQAQGEAAEQAAADAADAGEAAPAAAGKRKRGSALDAARSKVEALSSKVNDAAAKVLAMEGAPGGTRNKQKAETLAKQQAKVDKLQGELAIARRDLKSKEESAAVAATAKAAKEEAARQKAEENRPLTELGVLKLVEVRIGYDKRFDNTSDKAESVWAHVAKDYNALVDKAVLPDSDRRAFSSPSPSSSSSSTPSSPCRREVAALQKRWSHELGEFRLWCATANRAVQLSGVPADEVEEMVAAHRRPTTSLFRRLASCSPPSL